MKYAMIDLETLGQSSQAFVLQVAAVAFDPTELKTFEDLLADTDIQFSEFPNPKYQREREITFDTVKFWVEQQPQVVSRAFRPVAYQHPRYLLEQLNEFFKRHEIDSGFSFGSPFDFPILSSMYNYYKVAPGIKYRNQFDMRTLARLTGIPCPTPPGFILNHDALHDAIRQVVWLQLIFDKTEGLRNGLEKSQA